MISQADRQGDGMLLSDVRKVTLCWVKGPPTSHLIPAAEVDRFVDASKRLHWKPGRNPHNGNEAAKVWQITSAPLVVRGPFWWSTPDLQNNGDPAGARIIDGGNEKVEFVDEEHVARIEAEFHETEAAHFRNIEREARARRETDGS